MTTVLQEEGDMPTAPNHEDSKETLVKMATLWVKLDGLFERMQKIYVDWKAKMDSAEGAPNSACESSASSGSSVNRITINLGGSTLIVVIMLAGIIGVCGAVIGLDIAERTVEERQFDDLRRQYRMTELKYDDVSVVLHRAGLALPGDYARGPQGNLDTVSFTQPQGQK